MSKLGKSVQVIAWIAGTGALIALGCSGGDSKTPGPPATTGAGGTAGLPGTGGGGTGAPGTGGSGISFGNKDGGAGSGAGGTGGISFGNKDGGAGAGGAGGAGGSGTGGSGTGGTVGTSVTLAQFALATSNVYCDKVINCCTPAELQGTTLPQCVTTLEASFGQIAARVQQSVTAGRAVYHGDKWATCLNQLKAQTCAVARMGGPPGGMMSACEGAFEAKVPAGGTCVDNGECINGWCDAGVCVGRKADGAGCEDDSECASGACPDKLCGPPDASSGLCQ